MNEKKRKTGLGVDAFFPGAPVEEREVSQEVVTPATSEAPAPVAVKPAEVEERQTQPMSVQVRAHKPVKTRAMKEKRPTATREAVPFGTEKLTIMTPKDYLEKLDELKRQERRRLSARGEKNYRQQITVTYLVNQAIAEFLAKRGPKKVR